MTMEIRMPYRRVCACGCGASLADLRSDAVYASESCRKRAERANSADKGRTRRLSRDGKGTRVYFQRDELEAVRRGLAHLSNSQTTLGRDLPEATRRAKAKLERSAK